jgi:hypothetical protein
VKKIFSAVALASVAGLVIGSLSLMPVRADDDDKDKEKKKNAPTPIGAWFGIARPCPANPITDSPEHADFCTSVCGACPRVTSGPFQLPAEVPMMPTLLADGTVLADDAGEIGGPPGASANYHTTAHGKWAVSEHDGLPDRPGAQRLKATFFWLGSGAIFSNSVRPRFVTYFDPKDPDRMVGYIQPHAFLIVDLSGNPVANPHFGLVNTNPFNPLDSLAGNHIPTIDPLQPLPAGCQLDKLCLGTYHFVIRRIKAQ